MNNVICDEDLKTCGVKLISKLVKAEDSAIISVRGKQKYVILTIDEYNKLREIELDKAIEESKKEIAEGRYNTDTIEEHMKKVTQEDV